MIRKVVSLKLAKHLCELGYRCRGVEPNKIKPWFNVYLFDRTEALDVEIEKWKNSSRIGRD